MLQVISVCSGNGIKWLLAGDAFVTTNQESAFSVLIQKTEMHGPPKYFTYDWLSSEKSVQLLASLQPEIAATGHGKPMAGQALRSSLGELADNFRKLAIPISGRYVNEPAQVNGHGIEYIPPAKTRNLVYAGAGIAAAAFIGFLLIKNSKKLTI